MTVNNEGVIFHSADSLPSKAHGGGWKGIGAVIPH